MLTVPSNVQAPTTLTVRFLSPLFGPDLSQVTAVNAGLLRRDGTSTALAFAIVSATSRELTAQYTFAGGEITTTGAYFLAPQLTIPGGKVPSETIPMFVGGPYSVMPVLEQDAWLLATVPIPGAAIRHTWADVTASGVASPFLPLMAVDLRAAPLAITLWAAGDGDVAELTDVYYAAASHSLTLNAAAGQQVPQFDGTFGASVTLSTAGFTARLRFRKSDNVWIPR